ncbi:hypothetical protein NBRC110019_13430 [Neptunitalea chrysea]|uniref:DUF721 domain-containing protein n=1 Tax=Neptunitalea chrysea TaxID=1647581 RepID=A0A9W6B6S9_9FLAO|nr:DUF721 domain-containing protein [Neptunitalea chrysea]GLB52304.1 hypothetical protein NBRC110019_13430 [Neptunitalea chrysea]
MTKRYNEHISLSEALKSFIKENHLEGGIDKIDVRDAWIQLMGNGVANYTQDIILKNETLHVSLTSSVLREELSYGKQKIIEMINEQLGKELVKELILR